MEKADWRQGEKSLYWLKMCKTLVLIFLFSTSLPTQAATPGHGSIKVETDKPTHDSTHPPAYPYDSVDKARTKKTKPAHRQWPLRSQLLFSTGLYTPTDSWSSKTLEMLFFQVGLQFLTRPTYRYRLQTTILPEEGLMVSGTWDYTPSRKMWRPYYGVGAAHKLLAQREFSNLVELSQYYVTAQAGFEYRLPNSGGLSFELKTFIGTEDRAVQISFGYIIFL